MVDEAEYDQNRFIAAIHGIDIEAEVDDAPVSNTPRRVTGSSPMLFGDPEQYSHLSDQERRDLTDQMMGHWRSMGSRLMEAKVPEFHE